MAPSNNNNNNVEFPKGMPPTEKWEHSPLCLWDPIKRQECPIGVPFDFETSLFKGKLLFRVRNLEGTEQGYFEGRKRLSQLVIQGKFKENVKALDVMMGCQFEKRFKTKLLPLIDSVLKPFILRLFPGLEMDLGSDKPYFFNTLCGDVQQVLVHEPHETVPDMTCIDEFEEHTRGLGGVFAEGDAVVNSNKRKDIFAKEYRKRQLGKDTHEYIYDSNKTYTFVNYEDVTDFVKYRLNVPPVNFDVTNITDGEPFQVLCRLSGDKTENGIMCFYQIWHEKFFHQAVHGGEIDSKEGAMGSLPLGEMSETSQEEEEVEA